MAIVSSSSTSSSKMQAIALLIAILAFIALFTSSSVVSVSASSLYESLDSESMLSELEDMHVASLTEQFEAEEESASMDQLIAQSEKEMFHEEAEESVDSEDEIHSLAQMYEASHAHAASTQTHQTRTLAHNAPIQPAARSPSDGTLHFKSNLPASMKFKRMVQEAQERLRAKARGEEVPEAIPAKAEKKRMKHRSLVSLKAKVNAASKASVKSKARAKDGDEAPDGGDGDWTTAPSWWTDPGEENVKPWKEDNYGYLLRSHDDPNSNMSPNPYPNLAAGRFASPVNRFALHRVLNTPTIAGVPASVHAYQYPGSPPLPELDANMQPTNNYPNAPFYEHDYNKDYIWG